MGNFCGVRRHGLTLEEVREAAREVLDHAFPGIFTVDPGPGPLYISIKGMEDYFVVWYDLGKYYPGLIGGKHPSMGKVGYWLLYLLETRIAWKLHALVFDEGVGYLSEELVRRGAELSFRDYITRHVGKGDIWVKNPDLLQWERVKLPEALLPYFDGEKEVPEADNSGYTPPPIPEEEE